jgi:hypothetical protein
MTTRRVEVSEELPSGERAARIRACFVDLLYDDTVARGEAYLRDDERERHLSFEPWAVSGWRRGGVIDPARALPASVVESLAHYDEHFSKRDIGGVALYRPLVDGQPSYAVVVTTDGDDGWVELFDADGTSAGFGRTWIELVAFVSHAALRRLATADRSEETYPPALAQRQSATIWHQYMAKR